MYFEWVRYLKTDALTNFQNRVVDHSLFWSYEEVLWPQSPISRTYWYYIYLGISHYWIPESRGTQKKTKGCHNVGMSLLKKMCIFWVSPSVFTQENIIVFVRGHKKVNYSPFGIAMGKWLQVWIYNSSTHIVMNVAFCIHMCSINSDFLYPQLDQIKVAAPLFRKIFCPNGIKHLFIK